MKLKILAKEMKLQAKITPVTKEIMLANIATLSFPSNLKRIEFIDELDEVQINFQYSHDYLSEEKYLEHLSFSRVDHLQIDAITQRNIQDAFFPNDKSVINLGSNLSYVVQLGKLVIFDVQSN
jgi:hypothetical protein